MFRDIMVDLETLGQTPGCVFFSLGAVAFNATQLGAEFYTLIDIESAYDAGLFDEQSTLDWWAQQKPEARKELEAAHKKGNPTIHEALRMYEDYLHRIGDPTRLRIHGNGSDFDNAILAVAYKVVLDRQPPWKFWNNRCHRTNKAKLQKSLEPQRQGVYHNALDDAKHQARHAQLIQQAGVKVFV